jgi:hypothetical protein
MVMSLVGLGIKNHCADEDQQPFLDWTALRAISVVSEMLAKKKNLSITGKLSKYA